MQHDPAKRQILGTSQSWLTFTDHPDRHGSICAVWLCNHRPAHPSGTQAADSAISNDEQARGADYASAELTTANAAVRSDQFLAAEYLAVESRTHAELTLARAAELKAKAVNDDTRRPGSAPIPLATRSCMLSRVARPAECREGR